MLDPLKFHEENRGKIEVKSKVKVETQEDLATAYSPGVAEPCKEIQKDISKLNTYTNRGNTIAVVSDGSAVLGLGNIGAAAGLPVMEGKALLFKEFANVDAVPICLQTQDIEEIISIVKNLEPSFAGINLEDISAPNCFEIEERLQKETNIPIFHDDQHGTAIVCLAGLINAAKVVSKDIKKLKIVISGAGAAGIAITKLLHEYGIQNIIVCDSKGIISKEREDLNKYKKEVSLITNPDNIQGVITDALKGVDVFIGVSKPNQIGDREVKSMNKDSIIFALSNPIPEIMPEIAIQAGAAVVGTGRSDYPNQVNNVLAFPGVFRGLLDNKAKNVSTQMKIRAAEAIAAKVENINVNNIIPSPLDKSVAQAVAKSIC